jgi:hypothetical protein
VPFIRPVINNDNVVGDTMVAMDPGVVVTVYRMIADPPLFKGGDHATVTIWLPEVAVTLTGGVGFPTGVVGDPDANPAATATDDPTPLVAATVIVYDTPFVNPEIMSGDCGTTITRVIVESADTAEKEEKGDPEEVEEVEITVTVYDDTGSPPSIKGGVQDTVAVPSPNRTSTFVGTFGGA